MGILKDLADKFAKSRNPDDNATPLKEISQAQDQSPEEISLVQNIRGKIDLVRMTNSRLALEGIYMTNLYLS